MFFDEATAFIFSAGSLVMNKKIAFGNLSFSTLKKSNISGSMYQVPIEPTYPRTKFSSFIFNSFLRVQILFLLVFWWLNKFVSTQQGITSISSVFNLNFLFIWVFSCHDSISFFALFVKLIIWEALDKKNSSFLL